jgi:hypothetical protein
MNDFPSEDRDYYTLDDLTEHDLPTPADVQRRCPQAVEYTGHRGQPCYLASNLDEWLDGDEAP